MSDRDDITPEPNATLSCRPKHDKPRLRRSNALSDSDDDVYDKCNNKADNKHTHDDHHKDKKSKPRGLKKLFRSMTLGDKMRIPGQTSPNKHFENFNGALSSRRHTVMESDIKLPDDLDESPKVPKKSKLLRRSSIAEGGLGEFKWWEEPGDELKRIDETITEDKVLKVAKHPKSSTGDDAETDDDEDEAHDDVFNERRHKPKNIQRPGDIAPGKDPRRRTKRSDSIAEGGKAEFNWWDESLDEEDESSAPIGPRYGRGRGKNPKSVGFLMDVLAVASVGTFSYRIYEKPNKVLDRYDFDYWFDDYGWGYGERPNDVYGPSGRKRHSRSLEDS
ncbi:unnamed protein product [Owenia fusiformis]|uniref:Uncharacterized protein n=1 Tax=Owenia fusiformis TaxID=6347 RepID=A0A8J1UT70_OWEFU|nr:unnamed protein product [Owenia fusiformis]